MKLKLHLSAVLLGLADALRGHRLAHNADVLTPPDPAFAPPVITVGLPAGLDPAKVLARKIALIKAGTNALLAEKLATDAEQQQLLRDHHLKATLTVEQVPATLPVIKVGTAPDGTAIHSDALEAMKVEQLTEFAAAQSYPLGGATRKADIIAAILAAAKGGK